MATALSLCLITRNEQHNLSRAILSFDGLCDEVIVADTGSTDQTVEIARQLGAKCVSTPWCDDFSAARNFCLEHASGEWIFWLDADEELLPQSRPLLQECIARKDAAGWFVLRQDLARVDRTDLYTEMWQLRLFRRDAALRFVGRCHPDFRPSLFDLAHQNGKLVLPSAIRLRHWGYIGELRPAKLRRAAHLLKLELADRPGQLYYEIEYARTLLALGDRVEGVRVLRIATNHLLQHRDDSQPPSPIAEALIEWLLASPASDLPQQITRDEIWQLAERWFPRSVPILWVMSRRLFESGDMEGAARSLENLLELGRSDSYDKFTSFDPRLLREDAVLNLAVCYIRLARLDESEVLLNSLLNSPRRAEAEQNLAAIGQLRAMADSNRSD